MGRVQEWMGRADVQTTMRYLHYAPRSEDARLVAEAFRAEGEDCGDVLGRFGTFWDVLGRLGTSLKPRRDVLERSRLFVHRVVVANRTQMLVDPRFQQSSIPRPAGASLWWRLAHERA